MEDDAHDASDDEVSDELSSEHGRTSVKEQGPYNAKVESAEPVPRQVVYVVGVLAETLPELRVGEEAQLLEELAIEARRRRGARAARAPRARSRAARRRDAPAPRTSAPPASRPHSLPALFHH